MVEFQECSAYARQDATVMCLQSRAQRLQCYAVLSVYTGDVTMSCDDHGVIPKFTASTVALVPMYGEPLLA